ncbi:DUF4097 family beta strand repeat-containing protein [Paenibacillus sp. IHBB 10380]|uniref:DUF4097 family beta strand repeat-containing protein n=1 Tax=Paenibacillus sp. IHBB 10380 TaxID=1566358 RepID=UPI0005CFBA1A|nr:DUF4097 family beta strand repeat-containing protein [Paenibacillus sp. IHBB 10380]AJS57353.1 hypothetical protein UB51_01275 [Paenibacillus sp. IHBB 10380]
MIKNPRNILRVAIVLIIVAIIGNIAMYMMGNSPFNVGELAITKNIQADQVTDLNIVAETGSVKVIPVKGNEIQATLEVKATKKSIKDYHLNVKEDHGRVQVEIIQNSRMRLFDLYTDLQLTVGIPAVKMKQLQIDTDTGNINVYSVNVSEYRLASDTGRIEVNVIEGLFDIKSDTGNVAIALEKINYDIIATTDTGNINIQTAQAPEALRTKLETDSGKINVTLPHYKDGYIGDGGPLINLVSDTGNLHIGNK